MTGKGRGGMPDPSEEDVFEVRLCTVDYYMQAPSDGLDVISSAFMGVRLQRVPVLRVFGSTREGKKTCVHLHKCFPYLYLAFCDDWPQEPGTALDEVCQQLACSVEEALRLHATKNAQARGGDYAEKAAQSASVRQFVLKIQIVRGVPYYGCHMQERLYVKLYLLDPGSVNTTAALLLGGSVMNRTFQPLNSHIPFILQCMADNNIVGMGHIRSKHPDLEAVRLDHELSSFEAYALLFGFIP